MTVPAYNFFQPVSHVYILLSYSMLYRQAIWHCSVNICVYHLYSEEHPQSACIPNQTHIALTYVSFSVYFIASDDMKRSHSTHTHGTIWVHSISLSPQRGQEEYAAQKYMYVIYGYTFTIDRRYICRRIYTYSQKMCIWQTIRLNAPIERIQ